MPETVDRRIYFFRTEVIQRKGAEQRSFDPVKACQLIDELSFDDRSRYLENSDGRDTCVWPYLDGKFPRMIVGEIRRTGWPQIEEVGRIDPLVLGPRAGLVERTHVIFFPNGIVGAEFNFYGPRVSRLAKYMNRKCDGLPRVVFDMLLNRTAEEQLSDMEDVRFLHLRLKRDYSSLLLAASDSLPDALHATTQSLDSPIVEIIFRTERSPRAKLSQRALNLIRKVVGDMSFREGVGLLKAKGLSRVTGEVEEFDFLKDFLVAEKKVVRHDDRYRTLDSNSMFSAIEEAYHENREALEKAATLRSLKTEVG